MPATSPQDLLAKADAEGVSALALNRLVADEISCPVPIRDGLTLAAKTGAIRSMLLEAETRRVLANLSEAGISTLLLKGSALAYWLYASPHLRECADVDLLFRDFFEAEQATAILTDLGYQRREEFLPGDLIGFEFTCVLQSGALAGLEIDLHWQLSSSPIFAFQFSHEQLWAAAQPISRLGEAAFGLSPVHAYFHACMHRVLNISCGTQDRLKWLNDLHLLSHSFVASDWNLLITDAKARGLAGTCLSGINAAAAAFGDVVPTTVHQALAEAARSERIDPARMGSWSYFQWMSFLAFPSWRQRLGWLRQRLLPARGYMLHYYGSGSGTLKLISQRILGGWKRLR